MVQNSNCTVNDENLAGLKSLVNLPINLFGGRIESLVNLCRIASLYGYILD